MSVLCILHSILLLQMDLNDLRVYRDAMRIGEDLWNLIECWDRFSKDTLGKQLVRSVDSIAANISEGYGRYHYKENRNFCYYARGSLFETRTWLRKAGIRQLINSQQCTCLDKELVSLAKMLNKYINSLGPRELSSNDQ